MATRREIDSVLIDADDDMRTVIRKLCACGKCVLFVTEGCRLKGVMLTSVPANVRAHSLYTRMGFE